MGGLHKFMAWPNNLLTDSGGFQMVSLLALARVRQRARCFYFCFCFCMVWYGMVWYGMVGCKSTRADQSVGAVFLFLYGMVWWDAKNQGAHALA